MTQEIPPLEALIGGGVPEERLVIVIPGSGGPDANTRRIVDALDRAYGSRATRTVEVDWRTWKGNEVQAPFAARRLGARLGGQLRASARQPRALHLVGVSVGAHVADALAEAYAAASPSSRAHVRLTLLDPFTARGAIGVAVPRASLGVRSFGKHADYCEAVVNTDDPVPATNEPLSRALNYDVTAAASRASFDPLPGDSLHSWPAAWFGANARTLLGDAKGALPRHPPSGDGARGTVRVVG